MNNCTTVAQLINELSNYPPETMLIFQIPDGNKRFGVRIYDPNIEHMEDRVSLLVNKVGLPVYENGELQITSTNDSKYCKKYISICSN